VENTIILNSYLLCINCTTITVVNNSNNKSNISKNCLCTKAREVFLL